MSERRITGKHVFIGFAAAFTVIIGVNLVLAFSAVNTFPGLEVKNSYVASQTFNERKAAQESLGWDVSAHHKGGLLTLRITDEAGEPVQVGRLDATVGRATHVFDDKTPDFTFDGRAYVARVPLGDGNWNIRMEATALDGTEFRQRVVLIKE
ncbi:FixH family protein [Roseovarius sp. SYSU LYC5161]|jgi:nitrogen fixation protein FixH|uniref:FixH family protein n=1 Tax=Roseovarius halophilus (ex Wu et al. 2025) TaxID=3376060 RepID=UPI0028711E38|nr:FixH family protein [Roseovarius sp.]